MNAERWQLIKTIYSGALDRPAVERSLYLAESCAGDQELYSDINRLLAAHSAEDFLEDPSGFIAGLFSTAAELRFRPGELLANRFLIERFIARGGMGEVYS